MNKKKPAKKGGLKQWASKKKSNPKVKREHEGAPSKQPKYLGFRVVRNSFGEYWVGKSTCSPDEIHVFASFKDAQQKAINKTEDKDFNDDEDCYTAIDEIKEDTEDNCEPVPAGWDQ